MFNLKICFDKYVLQNAKNQLKNSIFLQICSSRVFLFILPSIFNIYILVKDEIVEKIKESMTYKD